MGEAEEEEEVTEEEKFEKEKNKFNKPYSHGI